MLRYILWILCLLIQPLTSHAIYPPSIASQNGMVVSEHYLASQVGADILRQGGNAIDAAVAVGYALAVVDPCCGNLGGGGFMTIRFANDKTVFLNFREKAPSDATNHMFHQTKDSLSGYKAVAVPGSVMGLDTALQKYGTLPRNKIMQPAIKLAKGFTLTANDIQRLYYDYHSLKQFQSSPTIAAIFLKNNKPYAAGDIFIQHDLAHSLQQISDQGTKAFYQGDIAKAIVASSKKNGGILSLQDFVHYTAEELPPITCTYRGYTIISAPPPSSGGITLCEMLNILEGYPLSASGFHSATSVHHITEAMRYAFYDRNQSLGDPDFVKNPIKKLLSKTYAADIRQKITAHELPTSSPAIKNKRPEYIETTHYSVTDKAGNAVSVTYTLNGAYGAMVMADHTGIFLNNQMDDFTTNTNTPNLFGLIQSENNSIQPNKRPLSSMTPTIITKDNKLFLVLGSPGGPRIITSVLLTILNVIDYGMDIRQAVDETRIHHQHLPDVLAYEKFALSDDTLKILAQMGYHLKLEKNWGAVAAIAYDASNHTYYGAMDDRRSLGKVAIP